MRKLITADVFALARIVRASSVRSELTELVKNANSDAETVGIQAFLVIMESLSEKKAEIAVYELISAIAEQTTEDIKNMPVDEFISLLKKISEENDLGSFFDSVFGISGKN